MDAINSFGKGRKDTADNKINKDTGSFFNNIKNFFTNLFNTKPADKKFNDNIKENIISTARSLKIEEAKKDKK